MAIGPTRFKGVRENYFQGASRDRDGDLANFSCNWVAIGNLNFRSDAVEKKTERFCYDSANRVVSCAIAGELGSEVELGLSPAFPAC